MRYIKDYKLEAILAPLCKLLEAGFELFVPLVVARMIDEGIKGESREVILQSGLLLLLLAVIGMASATTAQFYSAKIASAFGTGLRNDAFSHVVHLSNKEIETIGRDTLINRIMADTNQMQTGVNLFFRLVLRSPFIVFGAIGMALFIDAPLSVIFLVTIAILYGIVTWISKRSVECFKSVQSFLDRITNQTLENLSGVRVIRAFNKQKEQKARFDASMDDLFREQMRAAGISVIANPLTMVIINLAIVKLLLDGALKVQIGHLTQGQVVALVNYMLQILVELIKMTTLFHALAKSMASQKRLDQVFLLQNSQRNGFMDAGEYFREHPADIEFVDVGFAYPKSKRSVIEGITFQVKEGSFVGIIGGTGSGKSSLVQLIPRLFDVSAGEIRIGGKNIQEFDLHSLRQCISFAEQKSRLFKGTIASNLSIAIKEGEEAFPYVEMDTESERKERMLDAIRKAQAMDILKNGRELNSKVSQQGANFSGGQKQRLSLARAMLKNAKILILDDVSSALDFLTDAELRKTLREEFFDTSIFLVSQRISSIRHSDIILVLEGGKLVGMGKHEELKRDCEVYREICQSQLEGEV